MFTVMFAIPRTSGWVAQWLEKTTWGLLGWARDR
jgi:citrate synthase